MEDEPVGGPPEAVRLDQIRGYDLGRFVIMDDPVFERPLWRNIGPIAGGAAFTLEWPVLGPEVPDEEWL